MKNWYKKYLPLAMILCISFSLTGCGEKKSETQSENQDGIVTESEEPAQAADALGVKEDGTTDYLAKYTPEVNLTAWRYLNSGIKFEEGDDITNNIYTRAYKDELGINLSYAWTVPEEQFDQKLNISIASGDLPDIMWLTNTQVIEMTENDLLYDLTDLFETNTSQETKDIMQQDQISFDTAKVNGRLMALPHTGSAIDSLQVLYVRQDWLDKLGLKVPTTMDELLNVAEAFTTQDPDGNGQDDTLGLALTKNFIRDNHAGATGFFAGYHGYIRRWVDDGNGGLVYGTIQPEVKTALKQLQDMYAAGELDAEFGVKDRAKVTESIASGKIGITYGGMSTPGAFLKDNVLNDDKAEWTAIPLVSIDSETAKPIAKMPVTRYYAVSKECKNPEAIMKLIEFGTGGYSRSQDTSKADFGVTASGISTFQYAIVGYEPAKKNLIAHENVVDAIEKKDTSNLNAEELGYYDKIVQFQEGNREYWGDAHIFGSPSSFDIISQYVNNDSYLYNGFYGSQTETMVEKLATLEAMEDEVFTEIIMGAPIDTFDSFVEDWKKLGGDQITQEVNDWYQSKQ